MRLTRRGVLTGGVGAVGSVAGVGALVEYEVLPGRTQAYSLLGLNGDSGVIPDVETGPLDRGTLDGAHWVIFNPPGRPAAVPVVIALHGATQTIDELIDNLGVGQYLAASGQQFAIAAIDGGSSTYWHPRIGNGDPGALVLDGFLPVLADRGYDLERPGFLGWSMGGYGALLLASERADQGLSVGPVVATSPAVWEDYDETAVGAFDNAADFATYGMFGRRDLLSGLDVRVDCGRGDPFFHNVSDFVEGLDAEVHFAAGAHTGGYWRRVLPDQLDWIGQRISATGTQ
jgi:pimeloyl-ACP methyl ester carboxylesterase